MDAIMRYIAREKGYYGNSFREMAVIDMAASAVEDIKIPYVRVIYGGNYEADKIEFLEKKVPEWLSNIQGYLTRQSEGAFYIAGEDVRFLVS